MNDPFDCQKIIDKINDKYVLNGLESLLSIDPEQEYGEFRITLVKKDEPDGVIASASGTSFKNVLELEILNRRTGIEWRFANNSTTKGAGLLLLDLVSCYAAQKKMELNITARPLLMKHATEKNHTKLYKFYEKAGMKPNSNEAIENGRRHKKYKTTANNLRQALHNRYKGGTRRQLRQQRRQQRRHTIRALPARAHSSYEVK